MNRWGDQERPDWRAKEEFSPYGARHFLRIRLAKLAAVILGFAAMIRVARFYVAHRKTQAWLNAMPVITLEELWNDESSDTRQWGRYGDYIDIEVVRASGVRYHKLSLKSKTSQEIEQVIDEIRKFQYWKSVLGDKPPNQSLQGTR